MESAWTWILVYVLAFGVFQYVMYRYLQREDQVGQAVPDTPDGAAPPSPEPRPGDDPDLVRCPSCGTSNEAVGTFRYCRDCLSELPRGYRR
ncbi:DUF7577 domain-containing protein [Halococcoides cellulosivorans]|uniref:DUF7577 domain-containing protein n=1 Tax=Halococcoides cellulosivorans TaxID=1679096 RepID=A0A2R4X289_9EURY|nr:hypothetical protein [Halococcoides cellulosivorans]AWB27895.1 hypothetical protein HARCEL1_09305 [Halococcoides cellulosivorans]